MTDFFLAFFGAPGFFGITTFSFGLAVLRNGTERFVELMLSQVE